MSYYDIDAILTDAQVRYPLIPDYDKPYEMKWNDTHTETNKQKERNATLANDLRKSHVPSKSQSQAWGI